MILLTIGDSNLPSLSNEKATKNASACIFYEKKRYVDHTQRIMQPFTWIILLLRFFIFNHFTN